MALQGQSFFQASGDGDSWVNNVTVTYCCFTGISFWPADDPYVTSVGGTSLTMNGSGASYASEQVWNFGNDSPGLVWVWVRRKRRWDQPQLLDSKLATRPRHVGQPGVHHQEEFPGCRDGRGEFCDRRRRFDVTGGWGTSFAAPLWAAFTALVNQEAAANGQPPVGFLNPALYALGQSADYTNCFHDITVGNNATPSSGGLFPAVPGYDLCTGWGSPKGSNLIYALALPAAPGHRAQFGSAVHRPRWWAAQSGCPELLTDQLACEPKPFA